MSFGCNIYSIVTVHFNACIRPCHTSSPLLEKNTISSGVQVNRSLLTSVCSPLTTRLYSFKIVAISNLMSKFAKFFPKHFRGPMPYPCMLYRTCEPDNFSNRAGRKTCPSAPQMGESLFKRLTSVMTEVPAGIKKPLIYLSL